MGEAAFQGQGWGATVPGRGQPVVDLLEARNGRLTLITLMDGSVLRAFDVAWGRDVGADWEHVTLNCSPGVAGESTHFLTTDQIAKMIDPDTRQVIYQRTSDSEVQS